MKHAPAAITRPVYGGEDPAAWQRVGAAFLSIAPIMKINIFGPLPSDKAVDISVT